MTLEVISPNSVGKDTVDLRDRYHRAGVLEYWLVDARGDNLRFDILRHTPIGYEPTVATEGWLASTIFGRKFKLERERDRFGIWSYDLHVAPVDLVS